ncbi:hypothetical protein BSL78_21425 [Apostichopus japonicus]|uniref:Uncharacterized protein n=1 Tax=Stichopus japonicus TaxID=307972 RepID=A0A2G8K196_STIJA|nr:hypothetical protein BSL78_21425 [Apostichopus japonicus]
MATPDGPCLSPWSHSLSLPHNLYKLKKRKPSEFQNIQSTAKRRCFPSSDLFPAMRHETVSQVKSNDQSERELPRQPNTIIDFQPVSCGHDSLLHDSYSEADPITDQPSAFKNTEDFSSDIHRSRVTDDMDIDDSSSQAVARHETGSEEQAMENKESLRKRAEKLANTLQFMKVLHSVCTGYPGTLPTRYYPVPNLLPES